MVREGRFQCPCCDYYVLDGRSRHQVCPICCWEDDGQDLDEMDVVSATNHITLRQARENFSTFGASDQAALPLATPENDRRGLRRELRARRH